MSRDISAEFRTALYAQETGERLICLLELTHPNWPTPIRLTDAGEMVVSGGVAWADVPFRWTLPDDEDQAAPAAQLEIDNVGQEVIGELRKLLGTAGGTLGATMAFVLASDVESAEFVIAGAELTAVTYDAEAIRGGLIVDPVGEAAFAKDTFSPVMFPGLFS